MSDRQGAKDRFDHRAALHFRDLIDQYDRMRRREGMTPQRRGQLFNELVAELLRSWGLDGHEPTSAASARSMSPSRSTVRASC
jgi:hypothetical protein